jgi:hypothetical protein
MVAEGVPDGVWFDLSRTGWADIGGAARLATVIDALCRGGTPVRVSLPFTDPTALELARCQSDTAGPALIPNDARQLDARRSVSGFLRHVNLEGVLREIHTDLVTIQASDHPDIWDVGLQDLVEAVRHSEVTRTGRRPGKEYRFLFPLHWLGVEDIQSHHELREFLERVISGRDRGVVAADAATLTNVILHEVVDNVSMHAGEGSRALVGAWARSAADPPDGRDFPRSSLAFIRHAHALKVPIVDIVVADGGGGVVRALGKAFDNAQTNGRHVPSEGRSREENVLRWAWNRWSSSKDTSLQRGTRGLYRVDRVVQKYGGWATLRSGTAEAGWNHGGSVRDVSLGATGLPDVPGTFLRVLLPTRQSEAVTHRVSHPSRVPTGASLNVVRVGNLTPTGLSPEAERVLATAIEDATDLDNQWIVVLVDALPFGRRHEEVKAVELAIRQCCALRHPPGICVVGLAGGPEILRQASESLSEVLLADPLDLEEAKEDWHEIWDPVALLASGGGFVWAGGAAPRMRFLEALYEAGELPLAQIKTFCTTDDEATSLIRAIRGDRAVVDMIGRGGDQTVFRARCGLVDIFRALSLHLSQALAASAAYRLTEGPFVTPSLHVVREWIDFKAVARHALGDRGAAALVAILVWHKLGHTDIDHMQLYLGPDAAWLRDELKALLQCGVARVASGTPPRVGQAHDDSIFAQGEEVLCVGMGVLSGESAGRMLKQVLRQGGRPVGFACLVDARISPTIEIKLWGRSIPLLAGVHCPLLSQEGLSRLLKCVSPTSGSVEGRSSTEGADAESDLISVDASIRGRGVLVFSHVARPRGRHFTFFVDGSRLGEDESVVWAFSTELSRWKESLGVDPQSHVYLCFPDALGEEVESTAEALAERVAASRQDVSGVVRVARTGPILIERRHPPPGSLLVLLDWGAISGRTIHRLSRFALAMKPAAILTLILFSQLDEDHEWFLQAVSQAGFSLPDPICTPPLGLPPAPHRPIPFEARFLGHLRIRGFPSSDCPVCHQLTDLSRMSYPTTLLAEYSRRKADSRLRRRDLDEVRADPSLGVDDQMITVEERLGLLKIREMLTAGLTSTSSRVRLVLVLQRLARRRPARITHWLLHLLSVESHWLRQPPLEFRIAREALGRLALKVVLDEGGASELQRLHGLIVLRAADKERFIKSIGAVWSTAFRNELLAAQTLHDIFTLLVRPYHWSVPMLAPIREKLGAILKEPGTDRLNPDMRETLESLSYQAEMEYRRADATARFPGLQEAWAHLAREWHRAIANYPHYYADQAFLRMMQPYRRYPSLTSPLNASTRRHIEALLRDWSGIAAWLDHFLFPNMFPIRRPVLGPDGQNALGEARGLTMEVLETGSSVQRSALTKEIAQYASNPQLLAVDHTWQSFYGRLETIGETLIGGREKAPRLLEFLDSVPTDISKALSSPARTLEVSEGQAFGVAPGLDLQVKVFAPGRLVEDVFTEVFSNHVRYDAGMGRVVAELVQLERRNDLVCLVIDSQGTDPTKGAGSGTGFARLNARLRPFGGKINGERPSDEASDVSYRTTIVFREAT